MGNETVSRCSARKSWENNAILNSQAQNQNQKVISRHFTRENPTLSQGRAQWGLERNKLPFTLGLLCRPTPNESDRLSGPSGVSGQRKEKETGQRDTEQAEAQEIISGMSNSGTETPAERPLSNSQMEKHREGQRAKSNELVTNTTNYSLRNIQKIYTDYGNTELNNKSHKVVCSVSPTPVSAGTLPLLWLCP